MKRTIYVLFICFLLGSNIYLIVNRSAKIALENTITPDHTYQSMSVDMLLNNGYSLDNICVHRIDDLATLNASDLFKNEEDQVYLVCRISALNCEKCVDYAISKAVELSKDKCLKVIIWGSYENINSLKLIQQVHPQIKPSDFFLVPQDILPIDERSFPYYFTLNNNLIVNDVFVPDSYSPTKTNIYWDCIVEKWNSILHIKQI